MKQALSFVGNALCSFVGNALRGVPRSGYKRSLVTLGTGRSPFPTLAMLFLACSSQAASPAVKATLALPRTEAAHHVGAALALVDLGASAEAEGIVAELVALKLSASERVALVDKVGSAALVRLGRELPATQPAVEAALAAADAAARSPDRLERLVEALDGEPGAALEAIRSLRETGDAGVAFCVRSLAEAEDPQRRARLREALVALDPFSQPALFLAAGSPTEHVAAEGAYALGRLAELGRLRSPLAPALVVGRAFDPGPSGDAARWAHQKITGEPPTIDGAKRRLDAAIEELLAGPLRLGGGASAPVNFEIQLAARLASDLERLDPGDRRAARRAVVLRLESGEKVSLGSLSTLDRSASLDEALRLGLHRASAACCAALGAGGDPSALAAADAGVTPLARAPLARAPLVRALDAPHPTTRFAATEAVAAIAASEPFAGSSRYAESLLHFAAAEGKDLAIVASPQLGRAGETAGWLIQAGYAALPVNRGDDAVRAATESPDIRVALIDMSISLPGARETVFRLRRSAATALAPIALLAADGRLAEAQRVAEEHGGESGRIVAVARPHSADATATLASRLVGLSAADWPDAAERSRRGESARAALAKLAADGAAFYGLERRAERLALLAGSAADDVAIASLAGLGTPESQVRLLDAVSLEARPLEARRAAAEAFAASVREHGVLLTSEQVRRQYDRYNLSATAPAETQELLGSLLDAIERKTE